MNWKGTIRYWWTTIKKGKEILKEQDMDIDAFETNQIIDTRLKKWDIIKALHNKVIWPIVQMPQFKSDEDEGRQYLYTITKFCYQFL